jgi:serpin B
MKKFILFCILPGLLAFLPTGEKIPSHSFPHPEFTQSHNQFAFRFLRALLEQDTTSGNKLISPWSLYLSLALLSNGASHETRDSIAHVLDIEDMELPNLNSLCKEMQQHMPLEDDQVQFTMANSIWYERRKLNPTPLFERIAGDFYYMPFRGENLRGRSAIAHINQWAAQNTRYRLSTMIDHTGPRDWMYLLNALCIKGSWSHPFPTTSQQEGEFHVRPGVTKKVPFMKNTAVFPTYSDTSFTMVELPFGNGNNYSLYVLLPDDESRPIAQWAAELDANRVNTAFDKLSDQAVQFSLPKWSCNYSTGDLHGVFDRLGMGIAFAPTGEANFSNMFKNSGRAACVSQAVQQASIRVDESGLITEASPVTRVAAEDETDRIHRHPRIIKADHPFLYVLLEKQRNIFLLAGIVNDPAGTMVVDTPQKKASAAPKKRRLPLKFLHRKDK